MQNGLAGKRGPRKDPAPRDVSGQKFLTRGSGRVSSGPLGSGRVGSAYLPNFFGSGRAGSGLKNSGNFGSKLKFQSLIFPFLPKIQAETASSNLFNAVSEVFHTK